MRQSLTGCAGCRVPGTQTDSPYFEFQATKQMRRYVNDSKSDDLAKSHFIYHVYAFKPEN